MKYSAMILAAGSGQRCGLGYNKLLYRFDDGETILEKVLKPLSVKLTARKSCL